MPFPKTRLRRLREHPGIRTLVAEQTLLRNDLIQPLFVKEGLSDAFEIKSMPGQKQHSLKSLVEQAKKIEDLGIPGIILFGIPAKKDLTARAAISKKGIAQTAIAAIKDKCRKLVVIADVCLCEYLVHGHCGILKKGPKNQAVRIDNDASIEVISQIALSYARAGADVVAPSDMMDGRVKALRSVLDNNGFKWLPILSYAVKYASSFYAPFREAAENTPSFADRKGYQMNPANSLEALREAALDIEEGADMLLVKPALAYGDIVSRLREKWSVPIGAYSVSGEYSMIKAAVARKWLDEKNVVLETHVSIKRAGADFIITYWAHDLAKWGVAK